MTNLEKAEKWLRMGYKPRKYLEESILDFALSLDNESKKEDSISGTCEDGVHDKCGGYFCACPCHQPKKEPKPEKIEELFPEVIEVGPNIVRHDYKAMTINNVIRAVNYLLDHHNE